MRVNSPHLSDLPHLVVVSELSTNGAKGRIQRKRRLKRLAIVGGENHVLARNSA